MIHVCFCFNHIILLSQSHYPNPTSDSNSISLSTKQRYLSFALNFKMRDDDPQSISAQKPTYSSTLLTYSKKETLDSGIFGRGRYKFWALAAILLLAFWSMLTGTVTLRFSAGNLNRFSDDMAGGSPIRNDFDILEIEEREKVVEHMWDVYVNSRRIKLQRFWQEAFVAAYEDLTSDAPEIREAAITEIAKMSFRFIDLDLPPPQSTELSLRQTQQNKAFMSHGSDQ